jgi:hypothetical protein
MRYWLGPTTKPASDPAPVGPALALSDLKRFVILLTTKLQEVARPARRRDLLKVVALRIA